MGPYASTLDIALGDRLRETISNKLYVYKTIGHGSHRWCLLSA